MTTNSPEQNESNTKMEKEPPISQEKWGEERSRKARLENLEKARQAKALKTQNFSIEPLPKKEPIQDTVIVSQKEDINAWYTPLLSSLGTTLMSGAVTIVVAYIVDSFTSRRDNNAVTVKDNENAPIKSIYYDQSIFK